MKLTVDCVWCTSRRDFLKFLRTNETSQYHGIIDYYSISNKLAKTDSHGAEPSDTVIGLYLIKAIEDAATKHHTDLLYTIKNLNANTVEAVVEIFQDKYQHDNISINLIIVNREDYPKKDVLSLFETVKFIDKL